jgi:putative cardiolipin synthase
MKKRRILGWAVFTLASLLTGCASLPAPQGRTETTALTDTSDTRLGRAVRPGVTANPGKTGIHAVPNPQDAFAARVLLAGAAEKSIDAQYFLWHGDQVGNLLFEALWRAAGRGVRVRLLIDDINTAGLDPTLAALDAHPGIEVRLYNPFVQRSARGLNFLGDFTRLNHRMHNKSFTVDNQASIVGGRNIANEYFGAGSGVGFADLDVFAVGPAVGEVSREFDLYWNSASAYPLAGIIGTPGPEAAAALEARFAATRADPVAVAYADAVRAAPLVQQLLDRQLALEWTRAQLVYDDPGKTLDTTQRTDLLLFPALVRKIGQPEQNLDLVSPYFVPGTEGAAALAKVARSGVKVRLLTNSLAATDESAVHAGYAKHRLALLQAGVRIYELMPTAMKNTLEHTGRFGVSSSSALHAKTFALDQSRIFVGSFNFDLRSARLNTEMGLVIDSPALSQQLAAFFDGTVPKVAYEVRLTPDGQALQWVEWTPSGEVRYDTDPGTSWFLRAKVNVLSVLPIDWLL